MRLGFIKTGNDYNFKPEKFSFRQGEGPETLKTLNKIEVRYNTRKNAPEYPAVKSLYKWRNVFGYRLGGILRQAVVKLAEAPRHFLNAYNFQKAGFGTRKDIMDARTLEKGGLPEGTQVFDNLFAAADYLINLEN